VVCSLERGNLYGSWFLNQDLGFDSPHGQGVMTRETTLPINCYIVVKVN